MTAEPVIRIELLLALDRTGAFDAFSDQLLLALHRNGIEVEPRPNGRITEHGAPVGTTAEWDRPARIGLEWAAVPWTGHDTVAVELRFTAADGGTRIVLACSRWDRLVGDPGDELAGWFADAMVAPLLRSMMPRGFGDWWTDRHARRPAGAQSRAIYRNPIYHRPNFRAILEAIALRPSDVLLEVGCGGGYFLTAALRSGCRAAAIDHSFDMVRLARESNRDAIAQGRLEIIEASADHLPFCDRRFTAAVITGVLGFLPDLVAALREVRRVLSVGGRLVALSSPPELKGTPAAPEPFASRLRFYTGDELLACARAAGFDEARVEILSLERFAREEGVPEEHLALFAGPGAPFLIATAGAGS